MVNKINDFRLKKGYTQQELADLLKISLGHLSKIERGDRDPSLKLAVRIAKVLDCKLDDLFF